MPGFSAARARSIIVNDLGVEADEPNDSFDEAPIAAVGLIEASASCGVPRFHKWWSRSSARASRNFLIWI